MTMTLLRYVMYTYLVVYWQGKPGLICIKLLYIVHRVHGQFRQTQNTTLKCET